MDHPSQTKYWILKDSEKNDSFSAQSLITRIVPVDMGIQEFDVAYFWRQEDSSYFYAWGTFVQDTFKGARSPENQFIDFGKVPRPILVKPMTKPIMTGEVEEDPAFSNLTELRNPQIEVFEISEIQAAALNRLFRKHGEEAPPYPIAQPDESDTHIGDQPTGITVDKLLERGPSEMSILTRLILTLAGEFANQREQNRDRVTSSCLLFAAVEMGHNVEGIEPDNASQFLSQWLGGERRNQYENAFKAFINPRNPERNRGTALLTRRALRVFELAERVAAFVRDDSVTEDRGKIYARDLIGALLITIATDEKSGAAHRLRRVQINIKQLRRDYLDDYLNSDKNPEDDLERWKKILIELQPVPQPPPETPLAEIKPQLPLLDADIPSLVNHLNTEAEVRGFANIVAARDVKTPLSIGIFGDWGSGKSTFMEQMQRAVEGIATKVRNKPAGEKSAFLGNIVQIQFNAWHYVEANLWASLVSHIFDNLSFSEKEEKAKAEKRKKLFLSKLSSTLEEQRKAEQNAQAKQEEYQRANNALQEARRQQDSARVELTQVLSESIWPEVKRLIAANPQAADAIKDARDLLSEKELSEEELRRELRASRNTLGRIQWRFKAMMDDRRRTAIIIVIAVVTFLLPLVLAFLISRLVSSRLLEQTITGVTPLLTFLGGILTWLRTKRGAANTILNKLDQGEQQLDKILLQARSKHDAKVENLQKQVDDVGKEIHKETERVKELDKEKTEILNSLRDMEPARVLENFVRERASSDDYRKLLGVVALIRRDFKKLSDMLRDQDNQELRQSVAEILKRNEKQAAPGVASASLDVQLADALAEQIQDQASETNAGAAANTGLEAVAVAATAAPTASASGNGQELPVKTFELQVEETLKDYRIDRIVLYIDDLDRCPPKQVVDVLQAIHLLLAFELFVVVVGVDARWVRHALRKHYPEMLDEDPDDQKSNGKKETRWTRAATPRDYVEKIFQIPFWIKPMEPGDSEKLFKGLIPDDQLAPISTAGKTPSVVPSMVSSTSTTIGSSPASSDEKNEITQEVETETAQTALGGSSVKQQTDQTTGQHDDESKASEFDLSPESLLLDVNERNLMVAIGDIIGKSPRTVKRFVNIYRIIKAGLDAKRLAAFKGTNGRQAEYPAVLVLLSVAHGQPELTPTFFRALKLQYAKNANLTLKTFVAKPAAYPVDIDIELKESWDQLIKDLDTFCDDKKIDISLKTLNKWLPVIVRYTFQLGRLSGEIRESSAVD